MNIETVYRAIRDAIASNPAKLKADAIAARMLVSRSTLYGYGEVDAQGDPRKTISLERLVQFVLVSQDGRPLSALAALAGFACIRLSDHVTPSVEPATLEALHDFSLFMKTDASALLDGKVTDGELADIEKRADDAMLSIARVVAAARHQNQEGHRS